MSTVVVHLRQVGFFLKKGITNMKKNNMIIRNYEWENAGVAVEGNITVSEGKTIVTETVYSNEYENRTVSVYIIPYEVSLEEFDRYEDEMSKSGICIEDFSFLLNSLERKEEHLIKTTTYSIKQNR